MTAQLRQDVSEHAVGPCAARVEGDGSPVSRNRSWPIPFEKPVHLTAHVLRLGQTGVGLDGSFRRFTGPGPHDNRFGVTVDRRRRECFRKASPRERILRIDRRRARVVFDGLASRGGRELIPETAPS